MASRRLITRHFRLDSASKSFSLAPQSFTPHLSSSFSTFAEGRATGSSKRSVARRVIQIAVLSLTGGVALSAVNDLAIFHGCSSKAIEKASQNQKIIEALGEPIIRGAWYNASLAVGHRRRSVSCTFPVSGPQGTGTLELKAIRTGDDTWFSFLRHHDWDILVLEALLHIPSNDEMNQTLRISLAESDPIPSGYADCRDCSSCSVPANLAKNEA